jgi:hypothetical protein
VEKNHRNDGERSQTVDFWAIMRRLHVFSAEGCALAASLIRATTV